MKLTKIAGAVVAVIGAVAVGGSWYTGKQVEEKYQQLVGQANSQLAQFSKQYGVKMAIKEVQIDRHFFSSDAKYRFEVEMDDGEKLDFVSNDKINHGPLPLNRLAKFNFAPVLMSVEHHTQSPEQMKMVMGETLGNGVTNVSYSENTSGHYTFSPVKWNKEQSTLETSPLSIVYDYDSKKKGTNADLKLENFTVNGTDFNFKIHGFEYEMQGADDHGYPYLGLGKLKSKIETIEVKDSDGKVSVIKNIKSDSDTVLQGERAISRSQAEIENVNFIGADFGKAKFSGLIEFDAKLGSKLMPALSNSSLISSPETVEMLLQLVAKSLKFHINEFSLENVKGKFNTALILNMAPLDVKNISTFNEVITALSQSKFTLDLNREYMETVIAQWAKSQEKLSDDEAKAKAKSETDQLFEQANNSGFIVKDANNLKSELVIDGGKITLNGRELSEDEIQMALFVIMMGAGGLGK